jgi:hypothetical protein
LSLVSYNKITSKERHLHLKNPQMLNVFSISVKTSKDRMNQAKERMDSDGKYISGTLKTVKPGAESCAFDQPSKRRNQKTSLHSFGNHENSRRTGRTHPGPGNTNPGPGDDNPERGKRNPGSGNVHS